MRKRTSRAQEVREEAKCVRAYDEAIRSGGQAIPFEEAIAEIRASRAANNVQRKLVGRNNANKGAATN